jgi:phage shock protein A
VNKLTVTKKYLSELLEQRESEIERLKQTVDGNQHYIAHLERTIGVAIAERESFQDRVTALEEEKRERDRRRRRR